MVAKDIELLGIDALSVWRLSLSIGTRIGIIVGSVLLVFGLLVAAFVSLFSASFGSGINPWIPFAAVLLGVPFFILLLVLFIAAINAIAAWVYSRLRPSIGGLRATVENSESTASILRIDPRNAIRWMFVQLLILTLFLGVFGGAIFALANAFEIPSAALLPEVLLRGLLVQCVIILVSGIATIILYNAIKKPMTVQLPSTTGAVGLASIGAVMAAAWMATYSVISQIAQWLFDFSGVLGPQPLEVTIFGIFALPFIFGFAFLFQFIGYQIYNWGAGKWQPIVLELGHVVDKTADNNSELIASNSEHNSAGAKTSNGKKLNEKPKVKNNLKKQKAEETVVDANPTAEVKSAATSNAAAESKVTVAPITVAVTEPASGTFNRAGMISLEKEAPVKARKVKRTSKAKSAPKANSNSGRRARAPLTAKKIVSKKPTRAPVAVKKRVAKTPARAALKKKRVIPKAKPKRPAVKTSKK